MRATEVLRAKANSLRHAFSSPAAFKTFIEAPHITYNEHGQPVPYDAHKAQWSNEDLLPTPLEKRTWSWANYVTFYWGLSFGNWTLGSTMIGIGLNWWQSIIVIFVSQFISTVAMFFNSRCASVYHIGYPVVARSVFGMWGSFYVVAARAMLAVICEWSATYRSRDCRQGESRADRDKLAACQGMASNVSDTARIES
jgi:nucleobase:cation symporter-1, NCS1 family